MRAGERAWGEATWRRRSVDPNNFFKITDKLLFIIKLT
jgi:hypothetical protein